MNKLFTSTDQQVEQCKTWNKKYRWGFTAQDFKNLPKPPQWPEGELTCVVLVPYLKDTQSTFDSLWEIIASNHKNNWRWDEIKEVELVSGTHKPGLRWEVIDLNANRGKSPEEVRKEQPDKLVNAGVLAAAAHFPNWVKAIDWINVPAVCLAGYRVLGDADFGSVPFLRWDRDLGKVYLYAYRAGRRHSGLALPVSLGSTQPSEAQNLAVLGALEIEIKELSVNGKTFRLVE